MSEFNSNVNLFAGEKIYGNRSEEVAPPRLFTPEELSMINTDKPGVVYQGEHNLAAKIYIKGSNSAYFTKDLDTRSTAVEGQSFDVKKCFFTFWKKPTEIKVNLKFLILDDAILK